MQIIKTTKTAITTVYVPEDISDKAKDFDIQIVYKESKSDKCTVTTEVTITVPIATLQMFYLNKTKPDITDENLKSLIVKYAPEIKL